MKYSGVEYLGDIPKHWKTDRLKDVSKLRLGKTKTKSDTKDYLELEDISQWTGKILNKRNTLEVASDVITFYKNDVLFGKLRPYLAKVVLADFKGKCTGEILAIKPIRVDGKFLSYYLLSKHFINHCNNFSYGAKMPRINWNTQMSMFAISLPSNDEQVKITIFLDKACEQVDKTIVVIQKQIKTLTQYRQSLIHECVTGKKRIYQGDIN
jgi:restriction endonuclease S subunit